MSKNMAKKRDCKPILNKINVRLAGTNIGLPPTNLKMKA